MKNYNVAENTLPEAYHEALRALYICGDTVPCPDWDTERKEIAVNITVRNPLAEPMISRCFPGGPKDLEQYTLEMLYGIRDYEVAAGKWSYTYHERYTEQFKWVAKELARNPYSTRAVMDIYLPTDAGSEDPPCLQNIQYMIRDGKLDCYVLFRSNDAIKAAFMNMFALIKLQEQLAAIVGVPIGSYTHRANSFHCYARDYDILKSCNNRSLWHPDSMTYNYVGDWKELMEDSLYDIYHAAEDKQEAYENGTV